MATSGEAISEPTTEIPPLKPPHITDDPFHSILVNFPIGPWIFSLVCDLTGLFVAEPDIWFTVAIFTMVVGLNGALAAALPGFIDLLYYDGGLPPVRKIWPRIHDPTSREVPIILSAIGVGAIVVSAWLGGQIVHVYYVSVVDRE